MDLTCVYCIRTLENLPRVLKFYLSSIAAKDIISHSGKVSYECTLCVDKPLKGFLFHDDIYTLVCSIEELIEQGDGESSIKNYN